MENGNATGNVTGNTTELDFGKLHVSVHSVFSNTSTETVVDKVRKLILQHVDDPQLILAPADAVPLSLPLIPSKSSKSYPKDNLL